MGLVGLPVTGRVYVDSSIVIYTVERHPMYAPALRPFWDAVASRQVEAVSSELTLMEVLVKPFALDDVGLEVDYGRILRGGEMGSLNISWQILSDAARWRADNPKIKTPDAIHLATAADARCTVFLTNDRRLRDVAGDPPVVLLDEIIVAGKLQSAPGQQP